MNRLIAPLLVAALSATTLAACGSAPDEQEASSSSATASAKFAEGSWHMTGQGLPFALPNNEFGDVQTTEFIDHSEMQNCVPNRHQRVSRVIPQLVGEQLVLFSEQDGPQRIDEQSHLPMGYAQTAHGAALAAYNAYSLFLPYGETGARAAKYLFDFGEDTPGIEELEGTPVDLLPDAFRIKACSPQTGLVELRMPSVEGGESTVVEAPMVYEHGQWLWRTTIEGMLDRVHLVDDSEFEPAEWTPWPMG